LVLFLFLSASTAQSLINIDFGTRKNSQTVDIFAAHPLKQPKETGNFKLSNGLNRHQRTIYPSRLSFARIQPIS
jgi:hypothetical protein